MRHGPPQTPSIARATLQARPDGTLTIAVVADTHSRPNERALAHVAALQPDAVLHAGDVGLTVLNPGSIGPRRFTLPVVWGVIVLDAEGIGLGHRDAETGLPWRPSGRAA